MADNNRQYSNGEVVVHWKPSLCWHSAKCVGNLPSVFNVAKRPWVNIHGAETKEIIRVVELCPSGALSWSEEQVKN